MAATDPIPHGTLTGYVIRKCRCDQCRRASADYALRVHRLKGYGRWQPFVDAQPVRDHVNTLAAHGIGYGRTAELAGVSKACISRLLYGVGNSKRPPTRRMRPDTAARILALRPGLDLLSDKALTDAIGTRRRIQALMARGFTQTFLAEQVGIERSNFRRILDNHPYVQARTARLVAALFDELWDADPAERGVSEQGSRYVRAMACRHGWAPPAAWDDDTIDDPNAMPDLGATVRRLDALAEDAAWIARTTGNDPDLIAARLGITRNYLDKIGERRKVAAA